MKKRGEDILFTLDKVFMYCVEHILLYKYDIHIQIVKTQVLTTYVFFTIKFEKCSKPSTVII